MDVKKYKKGEMYWYINNDSKKENYCNSNISQDFLTTRPVLIVSDYIDAYHSSVCVVPTTTSDQRVGIGITMLGSNGKPEHTKLTPYRLRTVPIQYLKNYIGQLDQEIVDKVDRAILFHLGINSDKPPYVDEEIELIKKRHPKTNKVDEQPKSAKKKKKDKKSSKKKKKVDNQKKSSVEKKTTKLSDASALIETNERLFHKPKTAVDKKPASKVVKVSSIKPFPLSISDIRLGRLNAPESVIVDGRISNNGIREAIYKLYKPAKIIKMQYEKIKVIDKIKLPYMSNEAIAKAHKLTIAQSITLRKIVQIEIGMRQTILLNKLKAHDAQLSCLDNDSKCIFLTIEKSELENIIKKTNIIPIYVDQYLEELNLYEYPENE